MTPALHAQLLHAVVCLFAGLAVLWLTVMVSLVLRPRAGR